MEENANIEHTAQLWPPQKPKAIDQDYWFGLYDLKRSQTCVSDKTVLGHLGPTTGTASLEHRFGQAPINRLGMIEIDAFPQRGRQMRFVAIKIV